MWTLGKRAPFLAYVVTDVRGAKATYQARDAEHARAIAEHEGYNVAEVECE